MPIDVGKSGDVAIALVVGEYLDAGNAREFRQEIASVLKDSSQVILDLSQLQFVDSSGLGAILSCLRHLTTTGGELRLCGMTKPVRALFELVRMHRVFEIFNSREEALASFRS